MNRRVTRTGIKKFLKTHGVVEVADSHTHIFERPLINGLRVNFEALPRKTITTAYPRFPLSRLNLIESKIYRDLGVKVRRVSFGLPSYFADSRSQNKYVLNESKKNKTTIPVALVTPEMGLAEVNSLVDLGFKGLKPYPEFVSNPKSIFDYVSKNIIQVANSRRVPIILHVDYDINRLGAGDKSYLNSVLTDVEKLSRACKDTQIVLAHMGGQYNPKLAKYFFNRLASSENVLLSTSFCVNPKVIIEGIANFGPNRVLFGTDPPYSLIKAHLLKLSEKRAKEMGLHEKVGQIMITHKSYAWTNDRAKDLIGTRNSRRIQHVTIEQLKSLYSALSRLYSDGRINSKGIRAILSDNCLKLFG